MKKSAATTDWLSASRDERKLLYKTLKRLRDETGLDWNDIYGAAGWKSARVGTGYEDNFRNGRISCKRAAQLFLWLERVHPARAQALTTELLTSGKRLSAAALTNKVWTENGVTCRREVFHLVKLTRHIPAKGGARQRQTAETSSRTMVWLLNSDKRRARPLVLYSDEDERFAIHLIPERHARRFGRTVNKR